MSDRPFWADEDYAARKPLRVHGGVQIHSTRGTIARTWWSARFIGVLEELGVGGRLSRGRTYARSGQIVSLDVDAGAAVALVQGTRPAPYRVRIGLRVWDKEQWARAEQALADDAFYAATLLAGGMPTEIVELLDGLGLSLFPDASGELSMDCSCPDVTVPCKHLAAVFYLLAERFDADPFELLALRGRDRETLLANLRERRGTAATEREPSAPPASVPPLSEVLDRFYDAAPAGVTPPRPPVTSPDAVLDQVPELPARVRGSSVTDLLRPAYRELAADD
ncbi:SWIM zinc finger family protein [Pseudonocardia sp. KRD291]|uniref:SWIM zinc finger family protein n=1 Tax=Pseudonocardia sp. KRD291 TaxID=2792007 RepID=UPI001C4A284D|nr:SWIM zinc finger family protein [Pseudonocardia sp. KRD291]MBW0104039.1 SWIM zinc finger family protein [Pseudonocardia sp. KRD291]